jgi:hypothetical protein
MRGGRVGGGESEGPSQRGLLQKFANLRFAAWSLNLRICELAHLSKLRIPLWIPRREVVSLPLAFLLQPVWDVLLGLSHQLQQLGGVTPVVPAQPAQDIGTGGAHARCDAFPHNVDAHPDHSFYADHHQLVSNPQHWPTDLHDPRESQQAFTASVLASTTWRLSFHGSRRSSRLQKEFKDPEGAHGSKSLVQAPKV